MFASCKAPDDSLTGWELPEGWDTARDADGDIYFWNEATGEVRMYLWFCRPIDLSLTPGLSMACLTDVLGSPQILR